METQANGQDRVEGVRILSMAWHQRPMDTYRRTALSALRTTILVGIAALLILVLLPLAVAAQAAAH